MSLGEWGLTLLGVFSAVAAYSRVEQPWKFKWILSAGVFGVLLTGIAFGGSGAGVYVPFISLIVAGGIVDGLWVSGVWRPGSRSAARSRGRR
ncbi:hypothetical protein SAMN05216481_11625 [Streptomyces radiopugnans]|uniref:Uncharacterized protein n=1 Tax=Streptomyces radiopugnans TaxID=403935 RepID=A0A1H9J2M8_9ACTN|nr:hypothetical protein SAMN05216481_11625 [Streptomyces radiopugnans]